MCGPISAILSAVSTVVGTASDIQQSKYQEQVANQNAALAKQQQQAAARQGSEEIRQINQEEKQTRGYQRAAMGASGVDSGYGSGLNILTDTAYLAQGDRSASQYNTEQATWGYGVESEKYKAEAANAKKAGKMAFFTGLTELGGDIASYRSTKRSKWTKK